MKVILEPKTFDQCKTESDVEVYDFTVEEYEEFIRGINENN